MPALTATRVGPTLGGELAGIDLAAGIDADAASEIDRALLDHVVIVFRDQRLPPAQLVAFGRQLGELEPHVLNQYHHPEFAEILVLSNVIENGKPRGAADGGRYWHSDLSYMREPAKATVLHALEVPDDGGDTLFLDARAAYEALPDRLKRRIDGLKAVHNYAYRHNRMAAESGLRQPLTEAQRQKTPDVVHPVVRTHPDTGRPALYINPGFTVGFVGMGEAESEALKAELFEQAIRPEFIYAHKWRPGDVVIWDNRCSMHSATGGYTQNRTLHRLTVHGTVPF